MVSGIFLLNENETFFSAVLSENEDYNKQLGIDKLKQQSAADL